MTAFVDRRCSYGFCPQKDAYRMIGGCYNCGTKPVLGLFTVGHEARGGRCPACGCDQLYAGWHRHEIPVFNGNGRGDRRRTEVLWSNRPFPQGSLFDGLEVTA